jgi:hypothetical protein
MARYYEDIRVLGGTVSIGSLTSSTGNIFEVHGTSSVDSIIIGPSSSLVFDKDIITATLDTEFQVSGASYYMLHVDDRLYVTNYNTSSLLIYDNDLVLIDTLALPFNNAYYMSHNTTLGRIYIGNEGSSVNLAYYDIALNSIVSVNTGAPSSSSGILKYNPINNKVLTFNASADQLYVYDANLIYEQTISMHSEVTFNNSAYAFGVNLTTGDIFIPYPNYSDTTQVAIFDSTFTEKPLVTINKFTADWVSNIEFDPINNRMVWGVASDGSTTTNEIVFIDGVTYDVTFYPLPQSSPGSTNATGGSYVTFDQVAEKIIVFAYERFNVDVASFIYIIDVNDNDSVIFGPAETTQNIRYIAASNGLVFGMKVGGNFTLSKWSTLVEAAGIINADNLTSIHQYQLPNNSGTIALLDDIKVNTVNTVWVDATYGNNTTATKYDFTKPYQSFSAAISAAISGDTIIVRPGVYAETFNLKDGVNVHCLNGVVISPTFGESISTSPSNSTFFNCRFTGYAIISTSSTSATIGLRYGAGVVYIELQRIQKTGNSVAFQFNPGGNSRIEINVREDIVMPVGFFQPMGTLRGQSENVKIKFGRVFCYALPVACCEVLVNRKIIIEGDVYLYENGYGILVGSDVHYTLKGNIYQFNSNNNVDSALIVTNGNENSTVNFEGSLISNSTRCIRATGSTLVYIKNSYIRSEAATPISIEGGRVIIDDSFITDIDNGGVDNGLIKVTNDTTQLFLKNCLLLKDKDSILSGTSSLISKTCIAVPMIMDCTLVGPTYSNLYIASSDSIENGEFYFKNTDSNLLTDNNIVNLGSSLFEGQTDLRIFDIKNINSI